MHHSPRRSHSAGSLMALLLVAAPLLGQDDLPPDYWYVETGDGCQLTVVEPYGERAVEPIVVVHGGWGAEHSYLKPAVDRLDDRRFVFYDMRGSLRSACPDSLVSVEAHLADLDRVREALGVERMTLVGHSMGTWLAMRYLEDHPDRVKGLALVAPILPKAPTSEEEAALYREQQKAAKAFMERPAVAAEIAEEGLDRPEEEMTPREKTHKWRIGFAGVNLYHVERWRELEGGRAFYDQGAGSAAGETMGQEWNYVDDMDAHPWPITLIMGDHDFADPGAKMWPLWVEPAAGVEVVVLEEAGHNPWIDRPEAFREALEEALDRIERAEVDAPS